MYFCSLCLSALIPFSSNLRTTVFPMHIKLKLFSVSTIPVEKTVSFPGGTQSHRRIKSRFCHLKCRPYIPYQLVLCTNLGPTSGGNFSAGSAMVRSCNLRTVADCVMSYCAPSTHRTTAIGNGNTLSDWKCWPLQCIASKSSNKPC